jgi:osmotically-inducible protein OsmY
MAKHVIGQLLMVGSLVGVVACSDEPDRAPVDVEVERPDVRDDMNDAAEQAEDSMERAGDSAANAIEQAGDAAKGAVETADIKAALAADDLVEANDVNVDTNGETKVVTLKGTVPSTAARARAEAIAKREAEGYRIDNQIVVRGN